MKRALLTVTLLILLLSFASCGVFGDGASDEPLGYHGIIYDSNTAIIEDVRSAIIAKIGMVPTTLYSAIDPTDGEIVFGNTDRAVSIAAKAELDAIIASRSDYDCGYIIYSDGNSVAIYWNNALLDSTAISYFKEECVDLLTERIKKGVVSYELYKSAQLDVDGYWMRLSAEGASPAVVASLKKLYNYYEGSKTVDWLANLYDPEAGGFYFSISARDNNPFRADLESTEQLIRILEKHGAIANRNTAFPEEIKAKIVEFARNMQSPRDGYFYHPQWPQDKDQLNTDRYGRDHGWATSIIKNFDLDTDGDGELENQYPRYCAPNGTKCELHDGTDGRCIFPISTASMLSIGTAPLDSSVTDAVSAMIGSIVTPTATVSSVPDYSSRENFRAWLEAYNHSIKEDSGRAHNLNALYGEISSNGYVDIVVDHLLRVQEEVFEEQTRNGETPTGLWQRNVDYNAVWGILKYMSFYNDEKNGAKLDIKYVPYIINTCITVIGMAPDGDYAAWDLYNQWSSITTVITNVNRHYGSEGVKKIYALMRENAAELIDNSLKKIEPFKKSDGSFSCYSTGKSTTAMYGTPIALGVAEGDVNATGLICSMYSSIYICLGYSEVPLFSSADGERFIETVTTCEPISKPEIADDLDFEGKTVPSSIVQKFNSPGAKLELALDPTGKNNGVLYFESPETEQSTSDSIQFNTTGADLGCYLFETKMYVSADTRGSYLFQVLLGDIYALTLHKSGDYVLIYESPDFNNNATWTLLGKVMLDEWFYLRIECYPSDDGVPHFIIWVDDNTAIHSEAFVGSQIDGAKPKNSYNSVVFYSMRAAETSAYFDDCCFEKIDLTYDPYRYDY